jgi:hypothetical protein
MIAILRVNSQVGFSFKDVIARHEGVLGQNTKRERTPEKEKDFHVLKL